MSSIFDTPRWKAVLTYQTENGPLDVEHFFEEMFELHEIVERGPDWNTLIDIRVTLSRVLSPGLTVEAAQGQ